MSGIYLEKDNAVKWQLTQAGAVVPDDTITRVVVTIPTPASDVVFDTSTDTDITLEDSATAVQVLGGERDIDPGVYQAYFTVYETGSVNGLAWANATVYVRNWKN